VKSVDSQLSAAQSAASAAELQAKELQEALARSSAQQTCFQAEKLKLEQRIAE